MEFISLDHQTWWFCCGVMVSFGFVSSSDLVVEWILIVSIWCKISALVVSVCARRLQGRYWWQNLFHLQWQDIIQDLSGDVNIFTCCGGFLSEQDIIQDLGGDVNMLNSSDGNYAVFEFRCWCDCAFSVQRFDSFG